MSPETKKILHEVAAKHAVPAGDIIGGRNFKDIVNARHEFIWRVHHERRMGPTAIGRIVQRDHSTVAHALKKMKAHETRI